VNVLSLFDGMSCGQIALNRAGIKYDKYYASEIDKYAIQITQKNYPDTIQLGDIIKWKEWDIEKPDLIIGGSPCQGFSFAGKQLNFNDERSKLFFTFVEILNYYKPEYFLQENVKMKIEYERIITQYMNCYPVEINSALVSAQNRRRLFWSNIGSKGTDLFGTIIPGIEQPEDKGLLLKDILEDEVDEKYYISNNVLDRIKRKEFSKPKINPEKTGSINTKNNSGEMSIDNGTTFIKIDKKGNRKKNQLKAGCLTGGGHSGGNHSDMDLIMLSNYYGGFKENKPRIHDDGKSVTLRTPAGGGHLPLVKIARENGSHYGGGVFDVRGKAPTQVSSGDGGGTNNQTKIITHKTAEIIQAVGDRDNPSLSSRTDKSFSIPANPMSDRGQMVKENSTIRRLTPIECERLQTVPDNYTKSVSDTQRYKMLGNGWTVDVIAHIFKYLKEE